MRNIVIALGMLGLMLPTLGWSQMGFSDRIGDGLMAIPDLEKGAINMRGKGDLVTAMKYYQKIIALDSAYIPAYRGYAEAATVYGALKAADSTYQRIWKRQGEQTDPDIVLEHAELKRRLGQFDESQALYQHLVNRSATLTAKQMEEMQKGLEGKEWAQQVNNTPPTSPMNVHFLGTVVNTLYSEQSPVLLGDTLLFARQSYEFTKDTRFPKRNLTRILGTKLSGKTEPTASFELGFEEADKSVANPTFSADGKVMYYSVCQYINEGAEQQCALYMRMREGNSVWSAPVRLPDEINAPGFTTTQPFLAKLPSDREETLFFVSNRPGGKGSLDIWHAQVIVHGQYKKPINLSAVNTPQEEITPTWHAPSRTLYFSTDGRNTLGGYDVYKITLESTGWAAPPAHLGTPVNSGANDVGFLLQPDGKGAYLASNRRGIAVAKPSDQCCYDIVQVKMPRVEWRVLVLDAKDNKEILDTKATFSDLVAKGVPEERSNKTSNQYLYPLQFSREYQVTVSKEGYTSPNPTRIRNTRGLTGETTFTDTIYLTKKPPTICFVAYVYDRSLPNRDADLSITDERRYMPLSGATFKLERTDQNKVVDERTEANDNEYTNEVEVGARYKISARKDEYIGGPEGEREFVASPDNVDTVVINGVTQYCLLVRLTLYTPRDIVLYFHNDRPARYEEPGSETRPVTRYDRLYFQYVSDTIKTKLYVDGWAKRQNNAETEVVKMLKFFRDDVDHQFNNLRDYTQYIYDQVGEIKSDEEIVITVRAYASPRASAEYNKALTKRRIESVMKYFRFFDEGTTTLENAINKGQVRISPDPRGEEDSVGKGIPDQDGDPASIYSIPASLRRYVTVNIGKPQKKQTSK